MWQICNKSTSGKQEKANALSVNDAQYCYALEKNVTCPVPDVDILDMNCLASQLLAAFLVIHIFYFILSFCPPVHFLSAAAFTQPEESSVRHCPGECGSGPHRPPPEKAWAKEKAGDGGPG